MYTCSVSSRAKTVPQPRGEYLPLHSFPSRVMQDDFTLKKGENVSAGIVGQTVDYMSRFVSGPISAKDAFLVSLLGAARAGRPQRGEELVAKLTGRTSPRWAPIHILSRRRHSHC